MQNSKIISIVILIIMLAYFLFSQLYLVNTGWVYVYLLNPLFYVVMALVLKFLILSPYKTKKHQKPIIQYIIITTLAYTILFLLSGLFLTYGRNPYSTGIVGILFNLYSIGVVIFCREYIRYKIINNVFEKDRKLICILTVIVFSIQEISFAAFANEINIYFILKIIFATVIPAMARNSLFTYIELYTDYWSGFVYELITHLALWIPPILPKAPWVYTAVTDTVFPIILLLYSVYDISSKDKLHIYKSLKAIEPKGLVPLAIGIVLVIWFAIGIFPIKPIGVASGSMYPNINMGDIAIIQKCNANDLEVGTVIEYKRKDFSVIHRVVEINQKDGEFIFITQGDNNDGPDSDPVREDQIVGRVIAKIPYLAWPTIWIDNLRGATAPEVDVQMGK
ncbi:MAG: signal peptidase I [Clostridia bacterium]|nr:signal peptidase I [Clostridia bacterium]